MPAPFAIACGCGRTGCRARTLTGTECSMPPMISEREPKMGFPWVASASPLPARAQHISAGGLRSHAPDGGAASASRKSARAPTAWAAAGGPSPAVLRRATGPADLIEFPPRASLDPDTVRHGRRYRPLGPPRGNPVRVRQSTSRRLPPSSTVSAPSPPSSTCEEPIEPRPLLRRRGAGRRRAPRNPPPEERAKRGAVLTCTGGSAGLRVPRRRSELSVIELRRQPHMC